MSHIRRWILKFITPITRWMGTVEIHQTRMPDNAYWYLSKLLQDGDVIISRRMWALSNIGIPGFYKHATIYRNGYVIEAIGTGVQRVPLAKWLYTHDYCCVLRAKFASANEAAVASLYAYEQIGSAYDFGFSFDRGIKAFYCSELVYQAYQFTMNGQSPFTLRETFGVPTVQPMDFLLATDKFQKVWECR